MNRDPEYFFDLWLDKKFGKDRFSTMGQIFRPILREAFMAGADLPNMMREEERKLQYGKSLMIQNEMEITG